MGLGRLGLGCNCCCSSPCPTNLEMSHTDLFQSTLDAGWDWWQAVEKTRWNNPSSNGLERHYLGGTTNTQDSLLFYGLSRDFSWNLESLTDTFYFEFETYFDTSNAIWNEFPAGKDARVICWAEMHYALAGSTWYTQGPNRNYKLQVNRGRRHFPNGSIIDGTTFQFGEHYSGGFQSSTVNFSYPFLMETIKAKVLITPLTVPPSANSSGNSRADIYVDDTLVMTYTDASRVLKLQTDRCARSIQLGHYCNQDRFGQPVPPLAGYSAFTQFAYGQAHPEC